MNIFLVEDEQSLATLIHAYLTDAGYNVEIYNNGLDAREAISKSPDLWVLDIMLPGLDGYALLKQIKAFNNLTPVIFTSARNAELDRVIGLEMGGDDYLPKPFLPRELVIRIDRILNRINNKSQAIESQQTFVGNNLFDRNTRSIISKDLSITLTNKEYDLLDFLLKAQDKALSRTELIDHVWGIDYFGSERVVDDTVRRLRKKIPDLPIEPVYGYGYILKGGQDQ